MIFKNFIFLTFISSLFLSGVSYADPEPATPIRYARMEASVLKSISECQFGHCNTVRETVCETTNHQFPVYEHFPNDQRDVYFPDEPLICPVELELYGASQVYISPNISVLHETIPVSKTITTFTALQNDGGWTIREEFAKAFHVNTEDMGLVNANFGGPHFSTNLIFEDDYYHDESIVVHVKIYDENQ